MKVSAIVVTLVAAISSTTAVDHQLRHRQLEPPFMPNLGPNGAVVNLDLPECAIVLPCGYVQVGPGNNSPTVGRLTGNRGITMVQCKFKLPDECELDEVYKRKNEGYCTVFDGVGGFPLSITNDCDVVATPGGTATIKAKLKVPEAKCTVDPEREDCSCDCDFECFCDLTCCHDIIKVCPQPWMIPECE